MYWAVGMLICASGVALQSPMQCHTCPRLSVMECECCAPEPPCAIFHSSRWSLDAAGQAAAMNGLSVSGHDHNYPCHNTALLSTDADALTRPTPQRCHLRSLENAMHANKENGARIRAAADTEPCC